MTTNNIEKQFGVTKGNQLSIEMANEAFELVKIKELNFINFVFYTFSFDTTLSLETLNRYINESIEIFGIDYLIKKAIYFKNCNWRLFTTLVLENEQCNPNKLKERTFFKQYESSNFETKQTKLSKKMTPYGGIKTPILTINGPITKTQKLEVINAKRSHKKKARQQAKKEIDESL